MGNFLGCFGEPNADPPFDSRVDSFLMSVLEALQVQHTSLAAGTLEKTGEIVMRVGHDVAEKLFAEAPPVRACVRACVGTCVCVRA